MSLRKDRPNPDKERRAPSRSLSRPASTDPEAIAAAVHGNQAMQERLGHRVTHEAEADGWYGHAQARATSGSTDLQGDASLDPVEGELGQLQLPTAETRIGAWQEEDGNVRAGARGRISLLDGETAGGHLNAGGPSASANLWAGDDGVAVGAQLTMGEAAVQTNPTPSADRVDRNLRAGVSEGIGAEVRIHTGDADHDGDPEYGVGADIGPFSFDYTAEDPAQAAADLGRAAAGDPTRIGDAIGTGHQRVGPKQTTPPSAARPAPGPADTLPPAPRSAGPSWDRESQTSQLAARLGRPTSEFMRLGPDGEWIYDEARIGRGVRDLQREEGLPVTGTLDDTTLAAMQ